MNQYDKSVFANNLNRYMRETGIKASDICSLLNVSKSTVSSWCNAQKIPRMDKIESLANHFHVLKSDLIEEKEPPKDNAPTPKQQAFIEKAMSWPPEFLDSVETLIDTVLGAREDNH